MPAMKTPGASPPITTAPPGPGFSPVFVRRGSRFTAKRRGLQPWVGLGLVALGVGLDLLQGLTATRTLDPADMAANTVGVLIGLALSQTILHGWCQRVERLFS